MKLNQELVKQFNEGKIIILNEPKDNEIIAEIIGFKEMSVGKRYYYRDKDNILRSSNDIEFAMARSNSSEVVIINRFILNEDTKFKEGDKVVIVNHKNLNEGTFVIKEFDPVKGLYITMDSFYFLEHQLEFAKKDEFKMNKFETKFKVGDRVKIKTNLHVTRDGEFVVKEVPTRENGPYVLSGMNCIYFKEHQLEAVIEYKIGREYEFYSTKESKIGVLMAIIDHKDKYVFYATDDPENIMTSENIREIERPIMCYGIVLDKKLIAVYLNPDDANGHVSHLKGASVVTLSKSEK